MTNFDEVVRTRVLLQVEADDGASFDICLTRVPGIGEDITRENRIYRVRRVRHEAIDEDGKAQFGWHAFVEAEFQPEEKYWPETIRKSTRRKSVVRRKKRGER